MDKFFDILNLIWEFLNSSWMLAIIAVIGIIYFAVTYIKADRLVNQYRAEIQQKIVNDAYADYIHHKYGVQRPEDKTDTENADSQTTSEK